MFKVFLAISLLVLPSVSYSSGFFVTGNNLLSRLESSSIGDNMYGVGYVLGVHDALNGAVFCTPKNATVGQLVDTVLVGLKSAPTVRHNNADLLVASIFKAVFPCEAKAVDGGGEIEL